MTAPLRVAFLGLGRMGRPMAANLAAAEGIDLVVWNRTSHRAESFAAEHGVASATSPRQAADGAAVVVAMLADGDALDAVFGGDQGVLAVLAEGAVAVDMGTSGPDQVATLRQRVRAVGAELVDAPVSGSTPAAEAGSLLIMAGGDPAALDAVWPVLKVMGDPSRVGPPGAGATLKLAVNALLLSFNQALGEAVVLAESAGVDPETALDVIAAGAAGAPIVSYRRPQYLDPDNAPVTFTLELAEKDLRLAVDKAVEGGVPAVVAARTLEVLADLVAGGEGQRDMGFAVEAVRRAVVPPIDQG